MPAALTPTTEEMTNVGDGDFRTVGNEFLNYFLGLGRLTADQRVLDVGCGIGRMAIPLTQYLTNKGSYEGFDIVPEGIEWCQKHITPHHPNFHFHHIDVYNGCYYPQGWYRADEFRFPYQDEAFDFVYLTSVFTHMLPSDLLNFLSEVARVLKPGGRCLITYFLFNEQSKELIRKSESPAVFPHKISNSCSTGSLRPEEGVCYEESFIRQEYDKFGLQLNEPIHYGSWCGRTEYLSFQDIIVASKGRKMSRGQKLGLSATRGMRLLRPSSLGRFFLCSARRILPKSVKRKLRMFFSLLSHAKKF